MNSIAISLRRESRSSLTLEKSAQASGSASFFVLVEKALPFGERVSFVAGIVAMIAGLTFVLS
jgi:hypothetical protein